MDGFLKGNSYPELPLINIPDKCYIYRPGKFFINLICGGVVHPISYDGLYFRNDPFRVMDGILFCKDK